MQNKSLAELNKLSKAELITSILQGVTDTEREASEDGPYGQVKRVDVTQERLTRKLTSRRTVTWSYYPVGCVDEITIVETDDKGKETARRVIKHFADGRQPEMR